MVKKAIELALDLGGNMSYAEKEIEKLKKGLSKNKNVKMALQHANEEVVKEGLLMREYEERANTARVKKNNMLILSKKNGGKNIDVEVPDRRNDMFVSNSKVVILER